ncbi:MAG: DUF1254 domain-containing protein [Terriglobales bacterium]
MALRDVSHGADVAEPELQPLPPDEAAEAAVEAYLYAYPLVLSEITRRVMTNTAAVIPAAGRAPMNQFAHLPAFPDPSLTDVVRPNADTLYSVLWFDVSREPLLIEVPDSGGRYYLLQMLDLWSDVFAAPGKRTTGTAAQRLALTAPGWQGQLPRGVTELRAPTPLGWIIGRTQTNGVADYPAVHAFQAGLRVLQPAPAAGRVDPTLDQSPPVEQVAKMAAAAFFSLYGQLSRAMPPHANDYPILQRSARLGLRLGRPLNPASLPAASRSALEAAPTLAAKIIHRASLRLSPVVNGWQTTTSPIGTYGADYLRRAVIAYKALGANCAEDAIYPFAVGDAEGKPFDCAGKYILHFSQQEIPPVRAFWSLTMYNDRQFFAANPIHRYALGDRDPLRFNSDDSFDLHIQRDSPGTEKESNWLPAPASGGFSMNLRLYWPRPAALDGSWIPPPVRRV